jgi:hypothetical protein
MSFWSPRAHAPRRSVSSTSGISRAKELVAFARHQGYRLDELVQIIEDVG